MASDTPEARYAIYFVPAAETALYQFGAAVLGYDAYTGRDTPYIRAVDPGWPDRVCEPRVYGFHATLKPPFRLATDLSAVELQAEFGAFARSQARIVAGRLGVRALGSFVALVLETNCAAIDTLASECVRHFDRFRAPINQEERARRLNAPLTERQKVHLDRWGYPYVFDDFRFHMSLTGPSPVDDRAPVLRRLTEEFASRVAAPRLVVDRMVIAQQCGGAFCVVQSELLGN